MQLVTEKLVAEYLTTDVTLHRLDRFSSGADEGLTCQRWLRDSAAKRFVFEQLYGEFFEGTDCREILDVGGGLTSFTRFLAGRHRYHLVDVLAHDQIDSARVIESEVGRDFIHARDWNELSPEFYEKIVANDLFPNVDQRLDIFLDKFLPRCRSLKLSLTWYRTPRYYKTRRVDGDEVFYMLAWNHEQLAGLLERYASKIIGYEPEIIFTTQKSLYENGRNVCIVEFIGEQAGAR
jgi:hypothetical protein